MPTDSPLNPVFSSIRSLLIIVGMTMDAHGLGQSGVYQAVELVAGSIMVVGPAIWGVWSAIVEYRAKKRDRAAAVQAGINLAVSGNLLTQKTIAGETKPVPVTEETATQIVKDYAPVEKATAIVK